ncbi:MAG: acyl-CoA synthetase [Candidatus Binatia bacterium]
MARHNREALALVAPDGTEYSRATLAASTNRLVHGLRALGLKTGDCVATVLPNGTELIELYLACFQAGFYLTPINHHLTAPEVAHIVGDSDSKLLVGHERFAPACTGAAEELRLDSDRCFAVGDVAGFRPYASISSGHSDAEPDNRSAGQVMNYTSGTTGRPKGVRRPLSGADPDIMGSMFAMFLAMFGIQPEDGNVHLCGSPLYHTAVLVFASCSLHWGHTVVLMDKWTPERSLALCEQYRVTTSHMVPTQFNRLLALPPEIRGRYDLSSLRTMVHAAAPCPPEIKRRMLSWWGPVIFEYYAASEGGGTLVTPEEWLQHPGTVGRPWPGADIKIFDDESKDGGECSANQPGTVYIALGAQDFRYHKDERKTEDSRRGGYFTVGDIGYLDAEGYLYLCDRKADMIISGGVNIYPAEIESVLLSHRKVADVAVFGIPHDDWGEEVKAVVQPAEGVEADESLAEELGAFCEGKLAKYKRPRSLDFIEEMPRDPNGKLYKRKLRDPYWRDRRRAI